MATAALALASGAAVTANAATTLYSTVPNLTGVSDWSQPLPLTGSCDSATGCTSGPWMVFEQFTLTTDVRITDFGLYSYFYFSGSSSDFLGVNWSIWGSSGGASDPGDEKFSGSSGATLTAGPADGDPMLEAVSGLSLILRPGTYYFRFQNVFSNPSDWSTYATSYSDYPTNTVPIPTTAWFGQGDATAQPTVCSLAFNCSSPAQQVGFYIANSGAARPVVPEPSTWAMMLVGFAGLAWAARRRAVHFQDI